MSVWVIKDTHWTWFERYKSISYRRRGCWTETGSIGGNQLRISEFKANRRTKVSLQGHNGLEGSVSPDVLTLREDGWQGRGSGWARLLRSGNAYWAPVSLDRWYQASPDASETQAQAYRKSGSCQAMQSPFSGLSPAIVFFFFNKESEWRQLAIHSSALPR